ncbi:hypothetical protein DV515_00010788 [Chloebia gouldiae]|uniref:non-specific serine/threonine protein kinase n=1 Tax=Chloebia gouldiae TaxID=44316 RepID=A0A3L8S886_CHLGU|nr:hypothetical protein DV515_00010788 [Chloebia gouldiae]
MQLRGSRQQRPFQQDGFVPEHQKSGAKLLKALFCLPIERSFVMESKNHQGNEFSLKSFPPGSAELISRRVPRRNRSFASGGRPTSPCLKGTSGSRASESEPEPFRGAEPEPCRCDVRARCAVAETLASPRSASRTLPLLHPHLPNASCRHSSNILLLQERPVSCLPASQALICLLGYPALQVLAQICRNDPANRCHSATTLPPGRQLALSLPEQVDNEKEVDMEPAAVASAEAIHTSSLLGAEDADDETFLVSDTLSRSAGALDKLRVRLQKKCQLTAEVLEQLSMCGVPRVWCAQRLIARNRYPPLKMPSKMSVLFHAFLHSCLDTDPSTRWTAKELLQHPFLRTAVSLSVLPDMIRIARKICQAMEALHASSASLEEKEE